MKTFPRPLLTAALGLAVAIAALAAEAPARLTRADSFLGIHFDFHAGPNDRDIGRNTTRAMIENIIDRVHPDYLQIDCKGHPGYSSYPTKVGIPAPGIVGDPLRTWREVTAARGVALYLHYSGVFDSQAVKMPGWAAVGADGKPSEKATSFWGPYAQQRLIPQLRELAGAYGADGAWVDGECWASVADYSPAAIAAFERATGFSTVPRKPGEPHWFEFLEFHREAFRRYLREYVAAVNTTHPAFQLCSNWAFTDHMPEPVTAPVAFLSGDYDPDDSVNSARVSARFLAQQGRPWDLMAWSFSRKAAETPGQKVQKTAVQLQREAAVVLAQGGGFQAYFKQKRDGSIYDDEMAIMAEVAAFCRARQAIAHHSQSVPQVAVLLSRADQYHRNNGLFSRNLVRVRGVLQALLESQYSVDVVGEHHLAGRFADYPLIVVPECDYLDPAFRDELAAYASQGGNLLLVGPGAVKLFARELGATLFGNVAPSAPLRLRHAGVDTEAIGRWQKITFPAGVRLIGELRPAQPADATGMAAAAIVPIGRGHIATLHFTASQIYAKDRSAGVRDFVAALTRELFPQPKIVVSGSHDVDVALGRNAGRLLVHLVNTSGPHATQPIQATIAPLPSLQISVSLPKPPTAITVEPGARRVAFDYREGRAHFSVPPIAIYDIVSIQEP